jgi:hypothetical protein
MNKLLDVVDCLIDYAYRGDYWQRCPCLSLVTEQFRGTVVTVVEWLSLGGEERRIGASWATGIMPLFGPRGPYRPWIQLDDRLLRISPTIEAPEIAEAVAHIRKYYSRSFGGPYLGTDEEVRQQKEDAEAWRIRRDAAWALYIERKRRELG